MFPAAAAPAIKAAAPTLEDLAEAQLREQEALADARPPRPLDAGAASAREKASMDEPKKLRSGA
jgi:hypothetical protein